MIETAYQDGVAVLTMRHGKVNALDTELCQALCGALDQAADRAQAVMLTGTGTVFSAGVDLHRVLAGRDEYLGPAFRLTKRQLRLQSLARAEELAVLDADVDATWQAPPALDRIRAYLAALKSPPGCQ